MTMTVDQAKRRGFTGMASLPTAGLPAASLLLHMDGTNGSTTFTDSSANAISMTANGNAQLSTAQAKFGTASGLFDGTGDYVSNGGNSALAFGTADFTIMQWLRPATSPGSGMIVYDQRATSSSSSAGLAVYRDSAGKMTFVTGITVRIQGTTVLAAATWYHIAISRISGTTKLYINATQEGSSYTDSNSYTNPTGRPHIGVSAYDGGGGFNGYMDDVVVINGTGLTQAQISAVYSDTAAYVGGSGGTYLTYGVKRL